MTPIRVVVVDDHDLVRAGVAMVLSQRDDLEVVGEAGDGEQAVAQVARHRPDLVLMDVRMPRVDGIEATRRILATHPAVRVIILTTFDAEELVHGALRAGASGFLLKDTRPGDLVEAVRVVHRGDALLAPSVTRRLLDRFAAAPGPGDEVAVQRLAVLTEREREVLSLMARGASNLEVAAALFVSEATVKTHVGAILRKLAARDRVQAVIAAYDGRLVRPGSSSV